MSGRVNPGFNANDELGVKLPDDSQYEEIDLTGKTSGHDLAGADEQRKPPVEDETDVKCGWCWFRPKFLQRCRTAKWILFWLCWAGAMQGMVVNGFVNVVITTIERRYSLRSSQSGLIAGGYDIASFLCLIPVTYLGGRPAASKPRWLGWGILVMGLGSLVFTSPHFAVGTYRGETMVSGICNATAGLEKQRPSCDLQQSGEHLASFMWLFFLGQLMHGSGASPLYTLGVTFIDENVTRKMSSVYLGIYYTTAIVGPAIGYVLGGEFLKIYSDALTVDAHDLGLTPDSNVWIGAWWIGFLMAGGICILLSIPLLAFPPKLPGAAAIAAEKVSEAHGDTRAETFSKLKEIPQAIKSLLANPTFFFLNLAGASEGLLIAGFAAFMPKFIENQFSVNSSMAALFVGIITVPAGGGGTFLGGYLVKRLNLHCAGIIKLCMSAAIGAAVFATCFFLYCPNLSFAGLTTPYANNSGVMTLESPCNSHCGCSRTQYDPVCGVDDVMYFSPCYAACEQEVLVDGSILFSECGCVNAVARNWTDSDSNKVEPYQAINQMCDSKCRFLWPFVGLSFIVMFFTFLGTMPALTATLRCVQDDQRSFALGIQWIKVRLLGTIPAPMLFGSLIDRTCILWQEACDGDGACRVYANDYMGRYMLGLAFVGKALSILFFFLAWWCYKPPLSFLEALQTAGTPTSPDVAGTSTVPPILMNGHTTLAQDAA